MKPSESVSKYLYLEITGTPTLALNSTGGMASSTGVFLSAGQTVSLNAAASKIEVSYRFRTLTVSEGYSS